MPLTNLVLLGFMGTGKSSVGRAVAGRFGLSFVDTDRLVEEESGLTPAELLRGPGEVHFRTLEARAVRRAAALTEHVIATGGGVPLDPVNLQVLTATGVLVLLTAKPGTLARRLVEDGDRPLLRGTDPSSLAALLESRREAYERVPLRVATDGRQVEELAREIWQLYLRHRGGE